MLMMHEFTIMLGSTLRRPPLSHFRPPFFTRTSFYVDDGTQSRAWCGCGQQNWQIIRFYCQLFNKEYYITLQKTTSFNLESKLNLMQKPKDLESNEILLPNWSHLFLRLLITPSIFSKVFSRLHSTFFYFECIRFGFSWTKVTIIMPKR